MDNNTQPPSLRRKFSLRRFSGESYVAQKRLVERPSKPTLVGFRITNEDINATLKATSRPSSQRSSWSLSGHSTRLGRDPVDVALSQPRLVKTPWELDRSKRSGAGTFRSVSNPGTPGKLQELPDEILNCILDQIKIIHLSGRTLKARSYQNDLLALCLTTKQWRRVARKYLYREVFLPGNSQPAKNGTKLRGHVSPLRLLARALDESPEISAMVRRLRVSGTLADQLDMEVVNRQFHRYSTAVVIRDIILKCRNLEHFSGYVPIALSPAIEIHDALSSCRRLKSCVVYMNDPRMSCFINSNDNWKQLETLVVWYTDQSSSLGLGVMSAALQRLPKLKHLFLRGILPADFHNGTLLMLPPLKSLRLEDMHGVTDQGIQQLSYGRIAMSLERLVLSGLELTSLQTVQTLFDHFVRLKTFSLFQNTAPEMPQRFAVSSNTFSLASASIQYLHWDILAPGSTAVTILANSIAAGKFPSLRKVKIPRDDDGLIQKLCRPISLRPISEAEVTFLQGWDQSVSCKRSLRASAILAQLRAMRERKQPGLRVVVEDDESVHHTHTIGSFLGNMASNIEYSLEPGIEGTVSSLARPEDVFFPQKILQKQGIFRGEEDLWELDVLF